MPRVILYERIPSTDPRLGRNVNHDSESRRYAYQPRLVRKLEAVRHQRHVPVWDQGNLGSCTAYAGNGLRGTGRYFDTIKTGTRYPLTDAGNIELYRAATRVDPFPGAWEPDDTGSDGTSIGKALTASGDIAGWLTPFGLWAALDALQDDPVITGVNWYRDMFEPNADGLVRPTGALAGGHEFVVDEYDPVRGLVGCTNSWGVLWGRGGRFYMQAEDWGTLLEQRGDVTVFVANTEPPPVPTPDADDVFAAALRPWAWRPHIGGNARAAKAARIWIKEKGL